MTTSTENQSLVTNVNFDHRSHEKSSLFLGSTRYTRTEWVQRRFEANWKLPSTWKKNSSLLLETARALTAAPLIHPRPRVSYMWVCMCLELLMWELWCQSSFLYKVTAIPEKISEHWMLYGKTRVFSSNYFNFTHHVEIFLGFYSGLPTFKILWS